MRRVRIEIPGCGEIQPCTVVVRDSLDIEPMVTAVRLLGLVLAEYIHGVMLSGEPDDLIVELHPVLVEKSAAGLLIPSMVKRIH